MLRREYLGPATSILTDSLTTLWRPEKPTIPFFGLGAEAALRQPRSRGMRMMNFSLPASLGADSAFCCIWVSRIRPDLPIYFLEIIRAMHVSVTQNLGNYQRYA